MSCPLYGRWAMSTSKGARLVSVPWNVCALTEHNPCDMELQGMEPDVSLCALHNLHQQDAHPLPAKKGPMIQIVPALPERKKTA